MHKNIEIDIYKFNNGRLISGEDKVAVEYPLTIYLNNEELITIVCTPGHLEDLILGFLTSEGIIRAACDIDSIKMIESTGHAYVKANYINKFNVKYRSKRYITSCCGKSRENFYFQSDATLLTERHKMGISIDVETIFKLMEDFESNSEMFHKTGGVHNAGLCTADQLLFTRMDIGRHNALDKIYGHCLKNDITVMDKIMVFSGRISSEILIKTAKIGCGIILTNSAPTQLAVEMARELGITAVGFIRSGRFNVYSGIERIKTPNKA